MIPIVQTTLRRRPSLSIALVISSIGLASCHGPSEQAGRDADRAEASQSGVPYGGSGPNERIGAAQDRAAASERHVREAASKALEAQGQNVRSQAEVQATRMDEQTRALREAADRRAAALETQAGAVAK